MSMLRRKLAPNGDTAQPFHDQGDKFAAQCEELVAAAYPVPNRLWSRTVASVAATRCRWGHFAHCSSQS